MTPTHRPSAPGIGTPQFKYRTITCPCLTVFSGEYPESRIWCAACLRVPPRKRREHARAVREGRRA